VPHEWTAILESRSTAFYNSNTRGLRVVPLDGVVKVLGGEDGVALGLGVFGVGGEVARHGLGGKGSSK